MSSLQGELAAYQQPLTKVQNAFREEQFTHLHSHCLIELTVAPYISGSWAGNQAFERHESCLTIHT